jgi:signal transduction histidine kinase
VDAERDPEDPGRWLLRFSDNGIGIDAEYAERIFVIFQRLHARNTYPGTGIGLAMCRKIVEHHGGAMWLEPHPPPGTTFVVALPALPEISTSETSTSETEPSGVDTDGSAPDTPAPGAPQ